MLHGGVLSNDYVIWSFFLRVVQKHTTLNFSSSAQKRGNDDDLNCELLGFTARWTSSCFTFFYNNYQSLHQNLSCRSFVTFVWWG